MPSYYYKKSFAPLVSFYIIDSENFNSLQQDWLQEKISEDANPYKIILGHKPLLTFESTHAYENWTGKKDLKDTICDAADLYISGHSHVLEEVGQLDGCKVKQLVSGSGGSSARQVLETHKAKFYYEGNGFLSLLVEKEKIEYSFYDSDENLLYQNTLDAD
jgi:tartrate-resistant acid phosphatase type 5